MNPSKTANPTTGVIEAGPINSLTRKTNNFWHHNEFKQTRYWILKPQTHTHHRNAHKAMYTGGIRIKYRHPTTRTDPGPNPCSSWSDPAETLFFEPCSRRGNEI